MPDSNNTNTQPNGDVWVTLDFETKVAYVAGFLQGMFLGHCFTTWGLPGAQENDSALQNATRSYTENWDKFVLNRSYLQFIEGLDELYSDDRNRLIRFENGMWIVMNEICGTSKERTRVMIESFRLQ